MSDTSVKAQAPVFISAADAPAEPAPPRPERPSREFERLVSEDLRDKFAAGPAYKVLSRPENRVAWLQTLHDIIQSIGAQNSHDNALLAAHPDKPHGGGHHSPAYADAKREIQERKRRRGRVVQAANDRISEVRRLIGAEPLEGRALGFVVSGLLAVQRCVEEHRSDDALQKITVMLRALTEEQRS